MINKNPVGETGLVPPLPLFVLRPVLSRLIQMLTRRHPGLFDRLGSYGNSSYLIDPVDLPFALLLSPDVQNPTLTPHDRGNLPPYDAAIHGSIAGFVALVNGKEDGDALFFSRDLRIEGDTEAVLALRNAVDDMEIDLVEEIGEMLGPLAMPARFVRDRVSDTGMLLGSLKTVLSETFYRKTIDRSLGGGGNET